jgi:hypothetical protein
MTGVTRRKDLKLFPYSPTYTLRGIGEIVGHKYGQTEK